MENKKSNLVLITEGGIHTAEYFFAHGVYPNILVCDTRKFANILPYLTKDTLILFLIKGLSDFTITGLYALMRDLERSKVKSENVQLFSNVFLGNIDFPYIYYTGDLFYGEQVKKGKGSFLGLNMKQKNKIDKTSCGMNKSLSIYLKYKYKEGVKMVVHGKDLMPTEAIESPTYVRLVSMDDSYFL